MWNGSSVADPPSMKHEAWVRLMDWRGSNGTDNLLDPPLRRTACIVQYDPTRFRKPKGKVQPGRKKDDRLEGGRVQMCLGLCRGIDAPSLS